MSKFAPRVLVGDRPFGGQYVPESLIDCLEDLQDAFEKHWNEADFQEEFNSYLYSLRPPTQLEEAHLLTKAVGGARIYLKREDLTYTGSHAIVNALGQALLARRLNKTTILAETGSGAHGVAVAFVCQRLGLHCTVYIGARDARACPQHVQCMKVHGARVIEVTAGDGTIREAITEAFRATVEQYETAYLLLGGAYGPRPLPQIANMFQATIGAEVKKQMLSTTGGLPSAVVACAGIHSPGVGLFDPFIDDSGVRLIAAEGAGWGLNTEPHAAVLSYGSPGVYHGAHTLVLQDEHGQIEKVYSAAPDFCYPAVSPLLSKWFSEGRIEASPIADREAKLGCKLLSLTENVDCSIEDGHAIAAAVGAAAKMGKHEQLVICIGGGLSLYI